MHIYAGIADELTDLIVSPRKGTTGSRRLQFPMTWKLSRWYLTRVCYPSLSPQFAIGGTCRHIRARIKGRGRTHWLELLRFFLPRRTPTYSTGLCHVLHSPYKGSPRKEVLPALQNVLIEDLLSSGRAEKAIGKFVAARQLSGRPVAVHCWVRGRGW